MPAPQVVPDVVRCGFRGRWTNGRPIVNVLHARIVAAPGDSRDAAVDEWLERSSADWQSIMLPRFLNNYTFEGIDWLDIDSVEGRTGFEPRPAAGSANGNVATTAMAPHTALLVHKICEERTRGRRNGRWYLSWATEAAVDEDGRVLSSEISAMNTVLANLLTNLNEDLTISPFETVDAGVVSTPTTAGLPPKFLKISSLTIDSIVGTQRRRV